MRSRLLVFISIIQTILFLGHWLLYVTWSSFWGSAASSTGMKIAVALLSVSFVGASLCAWYSHHPVIRIFYTLAAVWLGMASYFLWASLLCWIVYAVSLLSGLGWRPAYIADVLFGGAVLTAAYGLINASKLRVTRLSVALPNLPAQWRGRVAALVSDMHLGHVRNGRFIRRLVNTLRGLSPDVVFLAGDLYDGTSANFEKLAEPWREYIAPNGNGSHSENGNRAKPGLGVYYIAGNHEEFYSRAEYHAPLVEAGVRELNNQKMEVDGLQVAGVHYRDAAYPERYRQILRDAALDRNRASVLLLHAPVNLHVAESEGISLQLSGHTHGGQFFPFTWVAGRVWGKFIHGLSREGNLQVYTNYGAGTWGPPLRVGTFAEIVLIRFE
ncbi:MAG TPA: metallophosphoesterase [Candidatus Angelobacter sp.]|nr:metallophosphoesterase [Candidatus Angelobacter sp.]